MSKTWNPNWDHSHKAQYFNPKQSTQPSEEFPQECPQTQIARIWREAEMIRPMKGTILQSIGNILFDSGWKILNVRIGEPGIFESTDIETELFNHRLHASNPQMRVYVLGDHLIVAALTKKEIGNRQMADTDPSIDRVISI